MADTYTWEEATSPPDAHGAPKGKTPKTFTWEEAQPPSDADTDELNRERRVEAEMGAGSGDAQNTILHSATLGLDRPFNATVGGLDSLARGHGFHSGYSASLEAQREQAAKYSQAHPIVNTALDVGGAFLTPGGAMKTTGGLLTRVLKSALTGAGYGAISGAANANEGVGNRATGGVVGGGLGAATSAVVEGIGGPAASALLRGVQSHFGNAEKVAVERLQEHLRMDKVDEAKIAAAIADWKKAGINAPNLLSVAGENTMGLLRAVASHFGPERNIAVDYARRTRANLGAQARERTQMIGHNQGPPLTAEETAPANQVRKALVEHRERQAEEQFRGPYAEHVKVTPAIMAEVSDKEGLKAIDRAIASSRAKKLYPQVKELEAMKAYLEKAAHGAPKAPVARLASGKTLDLSATTRADDAAALQARLQAAAGAHDDAPTVSGGALHQVQIALGELGDAAKRKKGNKGLSSGFFDRANKLSTELDAFPHLREARDAYKHVQGQIDALDVGKDLLKETQSVFSEAVSGLSPEARRTAQISARQSLIDLFNQKPRTARATLDMIVDGDAAKANLKALFGDEAANRFIDAAKKMRLRIERAQEISPRTGSQTEGRASDKMSLSSLGDLLSPTSILRKSLRALDHVSGTMSPKERLMLMKLGVGNPQTALHVLRSAPPARPKFNVAPAIGALSGQVTTPQDQPTP